MSLDWERHGHDWPNRRYSRFVEAGGVSWHVQVLGAGPVLLLIHGTGAATHSWRDLAPLLATNFTVVAPDLPGQGFSRVGISQTRMFSLPGMAEALDELLKSLDLEVQAVVGHSAGAAVAVRMCLDGFIHPRLLVSLNGVMLPLAAPVSLFFAATARMLSMMPLLPELVAWRARDRRAMEQLLSSTGSRLDARGAELYGRLARHPGHVAATLKMMNNWDLGPMARDLPRLSTPLVQLVGGNDLTVPPAEADRVWRMLPASRRLRLEGLGHLAHEEHPELIARILLDEARSHGVFPA